MQIVTLRAKTFIVAGDRGVKTLTVSPSNTPITVPDWVRKSPTFALGVKDKSIFEVLEPVAEPPVAEESPASVAGANAQSDGDPASNSGDAAPKARKK